MRTAAAKTAESPKYGTENIRKIAKACAAVAARAASRRIKCRVAKLIVLRALRAVRKHLVCFVDLLEFGFSFLIARMKVRVILLCRFAEGAFDLTVGCILIDAKHLVVICLCQFPNAPFLNPADAGVTLPRRIAGLPARAKASLPRLLSGFINCRHSDAVSLISCRRPRPRILHPRRYRPHAAHRRLLRSGQSPRRRSPPLPAAPAGRSCQTLRRKLRSASRLRP